MTQENKEFAKTIYIPPEFKKPEFKNIDDYLFKYTETFVAEIRDSWDNFVIDNLYKVYQELGAVKILEISKEDFKKFLLWALPKYYEEVLK